MIGVVPAAGEGTRLRPLTEDTPKGLVEIAGKPLLSYVFDTLVEAAVEEVVVVIGYKGEQLIDRFGESYKGMPLTYVRQDERLGLGHAVGRTRTLVDAPFVVLNGDNVFGGPIEHALARARDPEVDGVIIVQQVSRETARTTGVVEVDGEQVTRVIEKPDDPPSHRATTGCYVLPQDIFEAIDRRSPSERGEIELTEAINALIQDGRTFVSVPVSGWRVNVNRPDDIETVERRLR